MKSYKVVAKENKGGRWATAQAASANSLWLNATEKYDGENSIIFFEVPEVDCEFFEELLDSDENCVEYKVV